MWTALQNGITTHYVAYRHSDFFTFKNIIVNTDKGVEWKKPGSGKEARLRYMSLTMSAGSIIICPLYKLTISDQGPSHSATDSLSFLFNVKIFSRSVLDRGREAGKHFSPGTRTRSRRLSVASHATLKFTLVQATTAHRWSRGMFYSFFNLGARWRWSTPRTGRSTPGKDLVPSV